MGTFRVMNINTSGSSNPAGLTDVNGILYFTAYDGTLIETWKSDPISRVTERLPAGSPAGGGFTAAADGSVLFGGSIGGDNELWTYDGMDTIKISINPAASSNPHSLSRSGASVFFVADDGTTGRELWKSGGTDALPERPEGGERMSRKACLAAMRKAPLRSRIGWEQLRQITREP